MTMVIRSDDMRRRNRLTVLQIVRRKGAISRSEIAQQAALSPATVSTITNSLIAENVLIAHAVEGGQATGRGRPSVALSMNPGFCCAVVVLLKIGEADVAVVDYRGQFIARQDFRFDMESVTPEDFRKTLIGEIREVWNAAGLDGRLLARISVGVQGTTDISGTQLLWSPMTQLTDLPIGDWLGVEFGVPVRLANDCDLIATALNWRFPDRYHDNFAAILLAHGVGMGLFLRGRIINGTRSSGTEFGHMVHIHDGARCRCGSKGCIEAYAGDYAIARRYRNGSEQDPPDAHVDRREVERIAAAARAGDRAAIAAFEAAGRALGSGLAGMFALVDPFRVVFVGPGAEAFDLMEPALRTTLRNSKAAGADTIPIDLFPNEVPFVLEGCSIDALTEIDAALADGSAEAMRA